MKKIIYSIALILLVIQCSNKASDCPKEAIIQSKYYNDSALSYLVKNNMDSTDLNRALLLLNKSLSYCPMNPVASENKRRTLVRLKRYQDAILFEKQELINNPQNNNYKVTIGMLYDMLDDSIEANKFYFESLSVCDKRIESQPTNINNYLDRLVLIYMLFGEERGNVEISKIKSAFPNNDVTANIESMFTNFNKKEWIANALK